MKKTAEEFAKEQKAISISEFFEKNKHLLGFDNPTKSLLMAVKEAVDNSLDACQEAGILPDIVVKIKNVKEDIYEVMVEDNGPGIVKEQLARVFGKLLYGSKFHRLFQSRGQQGIGISSVTLYSQLTTGEPTKVWSKIESQKKTHYIELHLNTVTNEPDIMKQEDLEKGVLGEHGVKVVMTLHGRYRKTVEDYLKQTSISNPFAKILYTAPDGTKITYPRSVNELPKPPKIMKPHPYGVEFGTLQRMLQKTASRTILSFFTNEFSSVGTQSAKEICKIAKVQADAKPSDLDRASIEKIIKAMQAVKIQRPPLDCLSPIGASEMERSLKKEYPNAEFVTAITREPSVYRGFPFLIEVGIVYGLQGETSQKGGKKNKEEDEDERNGEAIELVRFANRVPLLYQQSACALTEAVKQVDWRRYNMDQKSGSLPSGPMKLIVHICSVWVPFVSESKEAVANYPEIIKETKLAIQDAGRKLSSFLSGKHRAGEQKRRMQIFDRYAPEIAGALSTLTKSDKKVIEKKLKELIASRIHIKEEPENVEAVEAAGKENKNIKNKTEEEED
ncbi:MAG: DNA topoisomerase VI subunit B [Candidatus Aenigmarchaeota archaeon]|nr:DNA topoisomerase VI subunit B [Candidatus Aenigmarchaeota archaeon]